jgi:hypothetical protein
MAGTALMSGALVAVLLQFRSIDRHPHLVRRLLARRADYVDIQLDFLVEAFSAPAWPD